MRDADRRSLTHGARADLKIVEDRIIPATQLVDQWVSCFSSKPGGESGPTSRSGHSDPVLDRVTRAFGELSIQTVRTLELGGRWAIDRFAADKREADTRLRRIADDAAWLSRFCLRHTEHSERPPDMDRATNCIACEEVITGVGIDRVRNGLCPACYQKERRERQKEGAA